MHPKNMKGNLHVRMEHVKVQSKLLADESGILMSRWQFRLDRLLSSEKRQSSQGGDIEEKHDCLMEQGRPAWRGQAYICVLQDVCCVAMNEAEQLMNNARLMLLHTLQSRQQ